MRRVIQDHGVLPKDIFCFDEIRIYASSQDLNTMTLELASVKDPLVRKIANPREAYTGIVLASGDGETLAFVLVTTKGIPSNYPLHGMELEQRKWDNKSKKVIITPITINFAVIHGITVLKVPPGSKAWCSGIITEAFCRLFMTRCTSPSILQVDRAPGHIDPVFCKLIGESGRQILYTPPGASGYVQACDDVINAAIQRSFNIVSTDWLIEKVLALHQRGDSGAVANPTLEEICGIMAKSLRGLTPAAQRCAFEHCFLTLPTDGSLDKEKGSKSAVALMEKYGESLVPTSSNAVELFPPFGEPAGKEGLMASIWETLFSFEKDPPCIEEFSPTIRPRPSQSKLAQKKRNR